MPIAAVPQYLGTDLKTDFKDASPGMRFGMYLPLWGIDSRSKATLWTTHDINYRVAGQDKKERAFKDENKVIALKAAQELTQRDKDQFAALLTRQQTAFASILPADALSLQAQSTSPFTTGLGNAHPLENGFAFLNPYGLPYLPGSGVKGVLRQAARELASGEWGGRHGWSEAKTLETTIGKTGIHISALDALFGLESQDGDKQHLRGALTFWDVIPQIKGNNLSVEIMTPHQGHYYQKNENPHDSGSPIPISFLTIPPGSGFTFFITCNTALLARHAPALAKNESWKSLLQAACQHAFEWLGFGAKTAVGYGAMRHGHTQTVVQNQCTWDNVTLNWDAGRGQLSVTHQGKSAFSKDRALYSKLPESIQAKLKKVKKYAPCGIQVQQLGNQYIIIEIILPEAQA